MTALIFSVLLLAYIIVPGIVFRRIFHVCVPLRRIQWSRTDELTAFVVTLIIPIFIAFQLVKYTQYFGHHPFGFPDSLILKWNDYKDVLSASYSEKYFDENRLHLLDSVERVCRRQCHFLIWYYLATGLWALLCGVCAYHYGNLRNWRKAKWFAGLLEKFAIPVISEWYAMFTPYTFAHKPERWVQVDALSSDGILYQGEAGLFHVGSDGKLAGFFLKNAKRFLRAEFLEAKKADKTTPTDKYWRQIPGESFFLPADKVLNLNFTYIPKVPLETLAEENLQKMKIPATVRIEKATVSVDVSKVSKPEKVEEPATATIPPPKGVKPAATEPEVSKNFIVCKHCLLNGRPGRLPRVSADTPVISRTDGRTYHLFLLFGPTPQPSPAGATVPGRYLVHFRYALDWKNLSNEPVTVMIEAKLQPRPVVMQKTEMVADKISEILEEGKVPAKFYKLDAQNRFEVLPIR